MPYDVAFSLPPEDVAAYAIIFGTFESPDTFNWNSMRWEKAKT